MHRFQTHVSIYESNLLPRMDTIAAVGEFRESRPCGAGLAEAPRLEAHRASCASLQPERLAFAVEFPWRAHVDNSVVAISPSGKWLVAEKRRGHEYVVLFGSAEHRRLRGKDPDSIGAQAVDDQGVVYGKRQVLNQVEPFWEEDGRITPLPLGRERDYEVYFRDAGGIFWGSCRDAGGMVQLCRWPSLTAAPVVVTAWNIRHFADLPIAESCEIVSGRNGKAVLRPTTPYVNYTPVLMGPSGRCDPPALDGFQAALFDIDHESGACVGTVDGAAIQVDPSGSVAYLPTLLPAAATAISADGKIIAGSYGTAGGAFAGSPQVNCMFVIRDGRNFIIGDDNWRFYEPQTVTNDGKVLGLVEWRSYDAAPPKEMRGKNVGLALISFEWP